MLCEVGVHATDVVQHRKVVCYLWGGWFKAELCHHSYCIIPVLFVPRDAM